jgi:glycolate oxidase
MRYAVIEPGVSHAQLADALYEKGLRFGWPVGPPSASVLACAINHGIGHLTGRYGLNSQMITSMEVILPTGELVRLGSAGITGSWHSLYPVPRLDGLFIGTLGTTGIVTKLGIVVSGIPDYSDVLTVSAENVEDMTNYMIRWGRYEAADDLTAVSWWLAQIPIPYPYKPKPDDEPEWYSYSVITGFTEKELEAKREMWEMSLKKEQESGSSVKEYEYPEEAKKARTQLPNRQGVEFHGQGPSLQLLNGLKPTIDGRKYIFGEIFPLLSELPFIGGPITGCSEQ